MKKAFYKIHFALLMVLTTIVIISCESESLDDVLSKEKYPPVAASMTAKAEFGTGSILELNSMELKIPVTVNFSQETSQAFTLQLTPDLDISKLITNGTLEAGTVPLTEGVFTLAPVVNIPIGVTSFTFHLTVSRSFLEIQFGKKIAMIVKILNPSKGNTVVAGQDGTVLVMKTNELIDESSVHLISFAPTTKTFDVPSGENYQRGSIDLTVSVPISLQGAPGADFTVDVVASTDTVQKYIDNGTLPNSQVYPLNKISIVNPKVRFEQGASSAILTINTKVQDLITTNGKMPTIAITLKDPSKFQLNQKKQTLLVVLDQGAFKPYFGTPFLIKGAVNAVSDPIYAAYYDLGGEGIAYHDDNGKSGDGNWRLPDMVDVSGDYNPRTAIGWTKADEWLTYTVYVEETGTYEMDMYWGFPNTNARYSVFMNNVDINGGIKAVQNTGAHNNQKSHKSTVQLTKGRHIFKVYINAADPDYRGTIFTRKS